MTMQQAANELQAFLENNIPLARATGAKIERYDDAGLRVCAPLALNSNHHGTAFGGSLYVVALAAGWGMAHLTLQEEKIDAAIYVRHAEADYLRPVTGELQALAYRPSPHMIETFRNDLQSTGRSEIEIKIIIGEQAKPALELTAQFAARAAT